MVLFLEHRRVLQGPIAHCLSVLINEGSRLHSWGFRFEDLERSRRLKPFFYFLLAKHLFSQANKSRLEAAVEQIS